MAGKALHVTVRFTLEDDAVTLGIIKDLLDKSRTLSLTDNYTIFELEPDEEVLSVEYTKD
jgi:hypothetical protein